MESIRMLATRQTSVATEALFDEHGRRKPIGLNASSNPLIRRRFVCNQPIIDYAAIHHRISRHLGCGDVISATLFQSRAEQVLQRLREDSRMAGLTNAVFLPFFLPQMPGVLTRDIGSEIETTYVPAVGRSFEDMFPGQRFVNHVKSGLEGKLHVTAGSRHGRLLHAMQDKATVGVLFMSLTEYSIPAALEQMESLPEHCLLAGGFDLCAALIGSPQLLLRLDGYPPLIWMSALGGETDVVGYHFEAYGYDLNFNRRVHFGQAAEYWASALTVIAPDD